MSAAPHTIEDDDSLVPVPHLAEVRYSLPDLLRELHIERSSGGYGAQILNQSQISRLVKERRKFNGATKPTVS